MFVLVAYGADDFNTVGKMREKGMEFCNRARD